MLVAMTRTQVDELEQGGAFEGLPATLREHFDQLSALLTQEGLDDWKERYGDRAGDWRPFGPEGPTIETLVTEIFAAVNQLESYTPPIVPEFHEIAALAEDRVTLRRLREASLVIMDNFSMRHPRVQQWFHSSMLDAYPTTAVLSIAPIQLAFDAGRELAVFVQMRVDELEFARRLKDVNEEIGTCLETADPTLFEQWLRTRIRKISSDVGARRGILAHMSSIGPSAQ